MATQVKDKGKIIFVVENVNREAGPKQKKERQDNLRMINEKIILQQALLAYQDSETHLPLRLYDVFFFR